MLENIARVVGATVSISICAAAPVVVAWTHQNIDWILLENGMLNPAVVVACIIVMIFFGLLSFLCMHKLFVQEFD